MRQNLRDLKVADLHRSNRSRLAGEVGLTISAGQVCALTRVFWSRSSLHSGISKTAYEKLCSDLLGAAGGSMASMGFARCATSFQYPREAELMIAQGRPNLIEKRHSGTFIGEDVDRLRSDFDGPAGLGNFQPLMSRAGSARGARKSLALLLARS